MGWGWMGWQWFKGFLLAKQRGLPTEPHPAAFVLGESVVSIHADVSSGPSRGC